MFHKEAKQQELTNSLPIWEASKCSIWKIFAQRFYEQLEVHICTKDYIEIDSKALIRVNASAGKYCVCRTFFLVM